MRHSIENSQSKADPLPADRPPSGDCSALWISRGQDVASEHVSKQASLTRLDSVEPAAIEWIAQRRVPRGALCVVAGEQGSCKSLLAVDWAARTSEGTNDADAALFALAADMPAPLLRARLDAAGAKVERVGAAMLGWPQPGDDRSLAQLERRIAALACGMQEGRACHLLIVDNLEAWAGSLDSPPSRARINYLLVQLAELALKTKTAIVVLAKLKGPAGSRAAARELAELSAIAPVVWLAANDAENPGRRLLLPVKNSLGPQAPAAAFRIESGRIAWESAPLAPDDALVAPPSASREAEQRDREEAAEWLVAALEHGPVESADLFRQARSCGISAKTLRRAGKRLGLKPVKPSFEGPWVWAKDGETEAADASRRGTKNAAA